MSTKGEVKFQIEKCFSLRVFYHSWHIFLTVLYLAKGIDLVMDENSYNYGFLLQPVGLLCGAIYLIFYLLSVVCSRSVAVTMAVVIGWLCYLVLITIAAAVDRTLYHVNKPFLCKDSIDTAKCEENLKYLFVAGPSILFLYPLFVYVAMAQLEYAKRFKQQVTEAAPNKL